MLIFKSKQSVFWLVALSFLSFIWALPVRAALININTAGSEELQTLNGIGPAYAQRIIDYRNANGPFEKIEDIKNVSGIGDVTFSNIKDFITVGSSAASENTQPVNDNSTNNSSTGNSSDATSQSLSSFSKLKSEINVLSASAVGTPLVFRAITNFGGTKKFTFNWSFGDGSVAYGGIVEHSYLYPGEYVVVLNITVPEGVITSRRNIKILSPELAVSKASPESIEITNKSKSEINLFGRVLMSRGNAFTFPQDTIILPGQKINFAGVVTGLSPRNIDDVYIMTVGDNPYRSHNSVAIMEEMRLKQITRIENELSMLQQELILARQRNNVSSPKIAEVSTIDGGIIEKTSDGDEEVNSIMTASVLSGSEFVDKLSFWQKIKMFFLRTQE